MRDNHKRGGRVALEWPKSCSYWGLAKVKRLIHDLGLVKAECHGCALGVTDKHGVPIKKPWYVHTNCGDMAVELNKYRCQGCHQHAICEGAETEGTGRYTKKMSRAMHRAWRTYSKASGHAAAAVYDKVPSYNDAMQYGVPAIIL